MLVLLQILPEQKHQTGIVQHWQITKKKILGSCRGQNYIIICNVCKCWMAAKNVTKKVCRQTMSKKREKIVGLFKLFGKILYQTTGCIILKWTKLSGCEG